MEFIIREVNRRGTGHCTWRKPQSFKKLLKQVTACVVISLLRNQTETLATQAKQVTGFGYQLRLKVGRNIIRRGF